MKSRFVETMDVLQAEAQKGDLTLHKVFQVLGEEGHALLLLILSLPFLQPIPIPGLSTPLGLLEVTVAFFLLKQQPPWLPKRFEQHKISSEVLLKSSQVAENIWNYIAKVVHPRWVLLHDHQIFRIANFLVIAMNGLLLALPLPVPFSNTVPTIAIVLNAIGHLEKDGLFILASYIWNLFVVLFFTGLVIGVVHFS